MRKGRKFVFVLGLVGRVSVCSHYGTPFVHRLSKKVPLDVLNPRNEANEQ